MTSTKEMEPVLEEMMVTVVEAGPAWVTVTVRKEADQQLLALAAELREELREGEGERDAEADVDPVVR